MAEFLQHLINGISLGAVYALIAVGYSMVYGILQLINFAHGEVVMLGAVTAFLAAPMFGTPTEPSLPLFLGVFVITMLVCGIIGYLIERLAYRPIRDSPRMNCLITAIGVSLFLQYVTQLQIKLPAPINLGFASIHSFGFGAIPQSFPELLKKVNVVEWTIGEQTLTISNYQLVILVLTIILVLGLQWIVFGTKLGKGMRAVSESTEIAKMLGIPVNRVIAFTFILGSVLAAAAAILVSMMYPRVDAMMGSLLGLKAFVAAVLGGIGNLPGAVLGGLLMGVAEMMTVGYISSDFKDAIAFLILVGVLLVRPSGLLGKARLEKV